MAAAYDALDDDTRTEIEDLVCEHSQMYSRQQYGFLDFTDDERERFRPVLQRLNCACIPARVERRYFSRRMLSGIWTGQSPKR